MKAPSKESPKHEQKFPKTDSLHCKATAETLVWFSRVDVKLGCQLLKSLNQIGCGACIPNKVSILGVESFSPFCARLFRLFWKENHLGINKVSSKLLNISAAFITNKVSLQGVR